MGTKYYSYTEYKKALDLLLVRGLSFREVSKITGVSTNTLQKWMAEARSRVLLIHKEDK